ncbi:MAG: WD40/YVTN/BNR-like repeat-containing protein [Vicinamibacterales bacterium]
MRRRLSWIAVPFVALAAIVALAAQGAGTASPVTADAEYLRHAYDTYVSMRQASPFRTNTWSFLGPTNISGRATDIAVATHNGQRRIYAGYATGGVWKSDDLGATWQAIFENMPSTSTGDLAVSPSNPDIVWVGTGEANIFRASMPGVGIYKSTDAGATWQHMGLTDTQTIARIIVHPTNPDIVYVAATGHEWTDNDMRGVFKTTDGGKTWAKIYDKSPRTGAIDLVMDPRDPNTLYASLWQRIRRKWSDPRVEPGYNEGGIIKTTDGGRTWTDASQGLPAPEFRGRIGLDLSRSNPDVLYALVDNYEIGRMPAPGERDAYDRPMSADKGFIKGADVYRSDDAGKTWRQTSRFDQATTTYLNNHSGTYGWVFGQMRVDPNHPDVIYTLGLGLNVSRDGGRTFSRLGGTHGDHHGLWIDPADSSILYSANDGGVYLSTNGGQRWTFAQSAHATQFYDIELDTALPFHAYGSIQDIGSMRGAVDLSHGRDVQPIAFESAPGGEGSNHAVDPNNPNIVYSHSFYGAFTRTDLGASASASRSKSIRPPDPDAELRAQWMAPFFISPHDASLVYAGYQYLFRSKDRGDSWDKISADLSNNNSAQMGENPSAIPYQTIVAMAESPKKAGLIYVGTDDGRVHTTIDEGREWTELTDRLPVRKWISRVVPSMHVEAVVYLAQRGREDDDFAPYVYRSADYGKTFKSIAGNLPAGSVNVIREDPRNPDVLYVGTDFGAFVSTNGGARWEVLGGNLPSVQVSDLQFQKRDNVIVISTYGRGVWVIDAAGIGR